MIMIQFQSRWHWHPTGTPTCLLDGCPDKPPNLGIVPSGSRHVEPAVETERPILFFEPSGYMFREIGCSSES